MVFFVYIFGAIILIAGLVGIAIPARIISLMAKWNASLHHVVAAIARVVLGIIFFIVAPYCHHSTVVRVVGIVALAAAVLLLAIGPGRFKVLSKWFLERPPWFMQVWSLVAVALGLLLIWAGGLPW